MNTLHVTRLSYPDACSFIQEARKFGIEANISTGSVSVFFDDENSFNQHLDYIIEITDKYNGTLVFDKKAYENQIKKTLENMGIKP
jgi:hypothetical protein